MTSNNGNGERIRYRDHRHDCGRLLFRAWLPIGARIETRCPKCGRIYVATGRTSIVNLDNISTVAIE